jgi:thiamine kinase-like enzyme
LFHYLLEIRLRFSLVKKINIALMTTNYFEKTQGYEISDIENAGL